MPTLHVRNVPTELYDRIKELAERERRSISAEVITLLERVATEDGSVHAKPSFSWAGALSHLKDEYTSVELQHLANDWRSDDGPAH
ncbi:MAG: hypothetical protein HUU16_08070 [Candidatus Omnitrophica bacterium]|nr:hypothetical protein [bacterium]NUN96117.1 hypothetical protein [Candidatus Omnitrophota bacterium]